jgi:hypothetical protein
MTRGELIFRCVWLLRGRNISAGMLQPRLYISLTMREHVSLLTLSLKGLSSIITEQVFLSDNAFHL